jgi:Leucine-rich repeat (LRR) protein
MGKTMTPELVMQKCKSERMQDIKNLNFWGNDLEDISLIAEMPNIEICSLSLNKIVSLKDFSSCKKLTELYLRKNLVKDLQEIKYLTLCPNLKVLWLWDNPIADHPLYRQYVVKLLPNLIKLDNNAVTAEERTDA